jgi:hypothetical protein
MNPRRIKGFDAPTLNRLVLCYLPTGYLGDIARSVDTRVQSPTMADDLLDTMNHRPLTPADFADLGRRETKRRRVHDRRPFPGIKQKGY